MTSETKPSNPAAESQNRGEAVPLWLIILLAMLLYWGALYFDTRGGWFESKVYAPYHSLAEVQSYQPRTEGPDLVRGERLFRERCGICHGVDGAGTPTGPPLANSEWVVAEGVNRLVRIPVLGLSGPIEVAGQTYNFPSGMAAVAPNNARSMFPDEDLAAVLSYIRQSFGNKAAPVTEEQVKAIRDDIGNRSQQLTVDELKGIPEKL